MKTAGIVMQSVFAFALRIDGELISTFGVNGEIMTLKAPSTDLPTVIFLNNSE